MKNELANVMEDVYLRSSNKEDNVDNEVVVEDLGKEHQINVKCMILKGKRKEV